MAYNDKRGAKASVLLCFSFYLASALLGLTQVSGQQIPVQPPPYACDVAKNPALANYSFCNKALPIDQRVADLVNRMNLTEKVWSTVSTAPEITRLGIPKYEWWSEGLHGVSNTGPGVRFGNTVPGATSFPMPILTAASFNMTLVETIGKVVSTEGRAMYNLGQAGLTYWSPTINIYRDPRWGRAQETPGEDPYLSGKYAAAYVRGLQQTDGGDANKLKVAACCKHYTAYDVDKWNNVDRFHFNALVTKQDLEDTFNPPFKACVLEGNAASVMCSYNQVNGKPTCADQDLLEGTVRGQWKLNGYIVSDCDSLEVIYDNQHYTKTPEEAAAMSIKAGLDLDCGKWTGLHGELAVKKGLLNESLVNRAVTNNFATLMRLGFFDGDPKQLPYGNLGAKDVCNAEHQELAREAARQGIVLLKNDANSLPLNHRNIKTLAVIGPNANATRNMIGNYEGIPCGYISPFQGLTALASSVYAAGCADIQCAKAETEDAIRIAASSDATVIVVGTSLAIEAEGLDRSDITLPGQQQKLVTDVAAAAKGPVILAIMAAGSMDISFAKTDSNISSILWVGFPGQYGGGAIADVIFGHYNPSGRLPMTWYPKDYITNLPMTTMNLRADLTKGYAGRTYRFYKGEAVYKFGDGLSYTRFKYILGKAPQFVSVPLSEGNSCHSSKCTSLELANVPCKNLAFEIQITVKNNGAMDGSNSVLLFATPPAMFNAPQKQLVAFQKVYVKAKSAADVIFKVDVCKDLNLVDEQGNRRVAFGQYTFQAGNVKHVLTLKI